MNMLLDLPVWALVAVKATLAILIALAVGALARHARASLRHAVYVALFALLLLLPLSPRVMPAMHVKVPVATTAQQAVTASPTTVIPTPQTPARSTQTRVTPINWLRDFYLAGVFFMLASLAAGLVRLRRVAAGGEVWLDGTRLATDVACANGIRRAVLVVLSNDISVPMTFGFRRQTIVVPAAARDWDDESLRRALRHELEHVRRDDWALQLVARVACALYWPHPLVWIAWRRFGAEAERACDDAVVRMFEPTTYAEQLVTLARTLTRRPHVPALAMASPTRLAERVHAILDPAQPRGPHGRAASATTVLAMAIALVFFGSVRLVAAVTSDERQQRSVNESSIDENVDPEDDAGPTAIAAGLHRDHIVHAAARGDLDTIGSLLAGGFDIDRAFDGDGTMLIVAARAGQWETVRYLLDRGADPNVPSDGDGNPLIAAADAGHGDIVKLLLDRGARIDDVVPGDENALITAASEGYAGIVRVLIERRADVNLGVWVDNSDGSREFRTPLNMARRHGHEDVVRMLIAAGARE